MKTPLDCLIGQTVRVAAFPEDTEMVVVTDSGEHKFAVEGGCCSSSYFYHKESVEPLIGKVVLSVYKLELPPLPEANEWEYTQLYGYEIKYLGGSVVLEFRNTSNGHYGGWMHNCSVCLGRGRRP